MMSILPEPFVSVVVPTYNRDDVLCRTLEGLFAQDYHNCEIIVVDQSKEHKPATKEFLCRHEAEMRYCRMHKPSLAHARNKGAEMAQGEIVLFVDDDVIPDANLVSAHAAFYSDPDIGGVAGRRMIPGITEPLEPVGVIGRNGQHVSNFSSIIPSDVEWASGCHMSFRRDLIFRAGSFEPKFLGTSAYEDVEFCFRIRRVGFKIRFHPEAKLVHLKIPSGGCGNRQRNLKYHYSAIHNVLLFYLRHYNIGEFTEVFIKRIFAALGYAHQCRNPFVLVPLAGAFIQVFHSYFVARKSLPPEVTK